MLGKIDVFHVEDIAHHILDNGFPTLLVVFFNPHAIVDTDDVFLLQATCFFDTNEKHSETGVFPT